MIMRYIMFLFLPLLLLSQSSMGYYHSFNQDRSLDDKIVSGGQERYTFQHFSSWSKGGNFLIAEMTTANYESNATAFSFMAWNPSFSLSKLSGHKFSWGIISDVSISLGVERGYDYKAELAGLSFSLKIPSFNYVILNTLYRHDNFDKDTYQTLLAWDQAFTLGLPWRFTGYAIYHGTDKGTSLLAEPQLLIEGKVFGDDYKDLFFGLSLYTLNESQALDQHIPNLVLKWQW